MQKGHHAVERHQATELITELVVPRSKVKIGPWKASLANSTQAGLKIKETPPAKRTVAGKNKV
jgi:hypothetical protein